MSKCKESIKLKRKKVYLKTILRKPNERREGDECNEERKRSAVDNGKEGGIRGDGRLGGVGVGLLPVVAQELGILGARDPARRLNSKNRPGI